MTATTQEQDRLSDAVLRPGWLVAIFGLALVVTSVVVARAQPAPWPQAPSELRMRAVEDIRQNTLEPRLGNGTVVDPLDWPASFFGDYVIEGQHFSCTSTLVGPRSLLTAAHCIADGGRVQISRGRNTFEGTCERPHPGYPDPISADWAICLMTQDVPAERYETISLNTARLRPNAEILLAGYGCQQIGGTSDGKFRTGPAFIERAPGEMVDNPNWLSTFAARERGDAFICPGDSGGAVYLEPPGFSRLVVAVNSHYDKPGRGVSFLSVLGTPKGKEFIEGWAERHQQRVCGVISDATNCRR